MNVLVFSSGFPPLKGGIEIFVYNICRQLTNRGHRVRVLTQSSNGDREFDRHQRFMVHRYKYFLIFSSISTMFKIFCLLIKEKTDLLFFGHFGSTHMLGGVLAKKILGIPYVILVHGSDFNAYLHGFTRIDRLASISVLRNAKTIIVNSSATKSLVESHGYPSSRIHIVNPGTDIEQFMPCTDIDSIRKQLDITNKSLLLSVSRLVRRKGHENVIRALPKVIDKIPDLLYIILGKGEEEVRLKALVQDMKLDSHVKFAGYVSEKEKLYYYQSCDAFIMTSFEIRERDMNDYEGFGIVYVEANACGKPVIAGKSGGIEDAVIDGYNGLLVNPKNINEIAETIIRILANKEYALRLGENGRKRVKEKLGWKMVGGKVESILQMKLN